MDTALIREIHGCLPRGRTVFHYFADRYALLLLGYRSGDGCPVAELKREPFSRLLGRAPVRRVLARAGEGRVSRRDFEQVWERSAEAFVLTVDRWGTAAGARDANDPYWQTSRPGWNLVLQLNFSQGYERTLRRMLRAKPEDLPANREVHPVMRRGRRELFRETLAWARIDLDFETDEALIEEVQSDWASNIAYEVDDWVDGQLWTLRDAEASARTARVRQGQRYLEEVLPRYRRIWSEAMLAAAIQFIRDELGIRRIFYHTYEGGLVAKQLSADFGPPRSLYTRLPRRFCFVPSRRGPRFVLEDPRLDRARSKVRCRARGVRRVTRRERLETVSWLRLAV